MRMSAGEKRAHLIDLDRGWGLWRDARIKSAGFPASNVFTLSSPETAGACEADTNSNVVFEAACRVASAVLRNFAADPLFREAITWQNSALVRNALDGLLRSPEGATDSKTRARELLVANYLQRYSTKNETIGFFGPAGWARFEDSPEIIALTPGPSLLAARSVYFEQWAIWALAERLDADPELRRHAAPRRVPGVCLAGSTLIDASGRHLELPPEAATLLAACDGETRPAALHADERHECEHFDELVERLEDLAANRLIRWSFEVPAFHVRPEKALRSLLEQIPEPDLRARALAPLDQLEAKRAAVEFAAGDQTALELAIRELDETFERVTGSESLRRSGEAYAARRPFYEDCRRDVECRLGTDLTRKISAPLSLLLESARWMSWSVAEKYRRIFSQLHADLRIKHGESVPLGAFMAAAEPYLSEKGDTPAAPIRETLREIQSKWSEILRLDPAAARCERSTGELEPHVLQAFSAPGPGWPDARYHTPDILVAAKDLDAFRRGDYTIGLGELHATANTVFSLFATDLCPDKERLHKQLEEDLPLESLAVVVPREDVNRAAHVPRLHYVHLELGSTRSPLPRDRVVGLAEMVIEPRGSTLRVSTRDHRYSFDVIECFQQFLGEVCHTRFRILPPLRHRPRVVIDGVIIDREAWSFSREELDFVDLRSREARFRALQRWWRNNHLPRRGFARVPEERKPFYVDFESPTFVELLIKHCRSASQLAITELWPDLDQLWMVDKEGRRYTCELRVPVVDPKVWQRP